MSVDKPVVVGRSNRVCVCVCVCMTTTVRGQPSRPLFVRCTKRQLNDCIVNTAELQSFGTGIMVTDLW